MCVDTDLTSSGVVAGSRVKTALKGRVLLVDDRRQERNKTALRLSSLGLQVTTAENGRDALEVAMLADKVNYGFELVILKVEMPVIDGLEATVLFRYAEFDGEIIAVSDELTDELRTRCADAGCSAVSSFSAADFHDVVQHHLEMTRRHELRHA